MDLDFIRPSHLQESSAEVTITKRVAHYSRSGSGPESPWTSSCSPRWRDRRSARSALRSGASPSARWSARDDDDDESMICNILLYLWARLSWVDIWWREKSSREKLFQNGWWFDVWYPKKRLKKNQNRNGFPKHEFISERYSWDSVLPCWEKLSFILMVHFLGP